MVDQPILEIIRNYLGVVNQAGIQASQAVLFGSWAKGEARPESDIDLIVIAPEFDEQYDRKLVDRLWELRIEVPGAWRIEPIPCGERQWSEDDASAIIEIARREGISINYDPEIVPER